MYVCIIVSVCMYVSVHIDVYRGQKKVLDPLELGLQMIVSHHVDAGPRTWVL